MIPVSVTPTGLRPQHTPSILVISYHPDDIQTEFPCNPSPESDEVLLTSGSLGLNAGQKFLQPMGVLNLMCGALSVDCLDMPQVVGITRSKTLHPIGSLYHVMLSLRKANQGVHQRVWGSKYHYSTQT